MKIAVLSNINVNPLIKFLKKDNIDTYSVEGYGNEIGTLLNPNSSICSFNPDIVFIIDDLMQIIDCNLEYLSAAEKIDSWFNNFQSAIKPDTIYYVSDGYLFSDVLKVLVNKEEKYRIEYLWQTKLEAFIKKHQNTHIFPLRTILEQIGEEKAFSTKMWYMGKILFSTYTQQLLCMEIKRLIKLQSFVPKKVLLLDLDNTLWGGLAGENDITPIELSDDHTGLAYKDLQRVILQMKKQGVILGIVSKNTEDDAMEIIKNHPHMILRNDDFAIKRINWNSKSENIAEIASQLNLGLDSIVFFDDNPSERQLITELLPDVTVPNFPDYPEQLSKSMVGIWNKYFRRLVVTEEDSNKTQQYISNSKREEFRHNANSFNDYLLGLDIRVKVIDEKKHIERITQLLNKTNQFNLTTKRHSKKEVESIINNQNIKVFAYQVADKFGDNGIVSVAIVEIIDNIPVIKEFVMSCRVMGKNIENAIIDDIENNYAKQGYDILQSEYISTSKNIPVLKLYDSLGYILVEQRDNYKKYEIDLNNKKKRDFTLAFEKE